MTHKTVIQVHRFNDELAIGTGGETAYLNGKQARALFAAIGKICRSIDRDDFGKSADLTKSVAARTLDEPPRCYRVIRMFENGRSYTLKSGLSLSEARAHCADDDSHSNSCTTARGQRRTAQFGKWFDCYDHVKGVK